MCGFPSFSPSNWLINFCVQLRSDGLIEVTLGNTEVIVVPLERLTRLQDSMDNAMADMWGDEYSDGYGYEGENDEDVEIQYDNSGEGAWERYNGELESDEWEDVEEAADDWNSAAADLVSNTDVMGDVGPGAHDDGGMDVDLPSLSPAAELPPLDDATDPAAGAAPEPSSRPSSGVRSPMEIDIAAKKAKDICLDDEDSPWQRFVILSQAPADHAFYASKHAQTTKTFMTRLNKEYRVLKSSLPGTGKRFFLHYCICFTFYTRIDTRAGL